MSENSWEAVSGQLAALDALARARSATMLVKVDGARQTNVYTVVISGSGDELFFRKDGDDLSVLVSEAVQHLTRES